MLVLYVVYTAVSLIFFPVHPEMLRMPSNLTVLVVSDGCCIAAAACAMRTVRVALQSTAW